MALVTDSFCERCGNRYVFSPGGSKPLSLKGARVLAKGLRNFVLTDGQSMSDALSLARLDDDRAVSSRIDEAFHKTFNFCMTCRQYACDRCWNSTVGACFSCAPEHSVEPVAPEEHLIVRTPVARRDSDWSLELEGPAVEPIIHPAKPSEAETQEAKSPSAWPAEDVRAEGPPAVTGARQRPNRSAGKTSDPEPWTLWPVADELSPEMTLTAEELAMVEAELGLPQRPATVAAESAAVAEEMPIVEDSAAVVEEMPVVEESVRVGPEVPTWVSLNVEQRPAAQAFDETEVATEPETAKTSAPESRASSEPEPTRELDQEVPTGILAESEAPVDEAADDATDGIAADAPSPAQPRRVLRMSLADPNLPSLTTSTSRPDPQPEAPNRTPIVARLFGRNAPKASAGNPWPHPTRWTERPITINDWWGDAEAATILDVAPGTVPQAAVSSVSPEQAGAPVAPAPAAITDSADRPAQITGPAEEPESTQPASGLAAAAATADLPSPVDAQEAVAMRLSAVVTARTNETAGSAESEPAPLRRPLFDMPAAITDGAAAAQSDAPGRVEAGLETTDANLSSSPDVPETRGPVPTDSGPQPSTPPSPEQPAPAPWPPLGAQWPPLQRPTQPWPAPVAAPVAAVVAAQRLGAAPSVAAMWAQSAQEVLSHGSVRVCPKCALPVSTHARFCRRCGTQQA